MTNTCRKCYKRFPGFYQMAEKPENTKITHPLVHEIRTGTDAKKC